MRDLKCADLLKALAVEQLLGGGPPLDAATKSRVKLLEQEIGEKRRALRDIPDTEKNLEKRNKVQNEIADLTFNLHRAFPASPAAGAPMAPPSNMSVVPTAAVPQPPASMYFGQQPAFQFPQVLQQGQPTSTNAPGNVQRSLKILNVRKKN